jgi:NTE family protein
LKRRIALLVALAALWGGAAPAAEPRIGLALSGGGARGLAHIGVLKVLEELRVPVHCIAGTSMGAIVGGAYASGMTAAELEEFSLRADWDAVFRDHPPRAEVAVRRKVDDYKTLFAPEYGVRKSGLVAPKGVLAGVSIEGFLRALTERAAGVDDFRKLPVPFSAVAADIESGEAMVLSRGSLARALRASMSIPGAIAPVEIDGRLLVDGGIANNLPIDLARKLCAADAVIAVNISTPPLELAQITSAISVSAQLINFLGKANVDRQLKSLGGRDVLISPELGDISAGSFAAAREAIGVGEEATRWMADSLRRYSLPAEKYAALRKAQTLERKGLGTVSEVRFEGLRRTNAQVLRSLVRSRPGEPLSEEEISADLRRIYGTGDFESVDYRIHDEPGGRVLVIVPREKESGPDYLRFGLGLATDFEGESLFNLLVSYRRTWLNRLGGEWLIEGQVGQDTHLFTEFFQPVEERGRYFVAPYARVGRTVRGVFFDDQHLADYEIDEGRLGLDGGITFGTWGQARLGPQWRSIDTRLRTGPALLPEVDEISAGLRAQFFVDQLDNAWFPRGGFRAFASAYAADEAFGSDRSYERVEVQATAAYSWAAHTVNIGLAGGSDFHSDAPAYDTFTLGGPLRLSGYRIEEFSGRRMGFARLMYYNRAVRFPDILGAGLYAGASLEAGRIESRVDGFPEAGTIWSGSLFIAASTFAGPAYFGAGFGEGGRFTLYLLVGAP